MKYQPKTSQVEAWRVTGPEENSNPPLWVIENFRSGLFLGDKDYGVTISGKINLLVAAGDWITLDSNNNIGMLQHEKFSAEYEVVQDFTARAPRPTK